MNIDIPEPPYANECECTEGVMCGWCRAMSDEPPADYWGRECRPELDGGVW